MRRLTSWLPKYRGWMKPITRPAKQVDLFTNYLVRTEDDAARVAERLIEATRMPPAFRPFVAMGSAVPRGYGSYEHDLECE